MKVMPLMPKGLVKKRDPHPTRSHPDSVSGGKNFPRGACLSPPSKSMLIALYTLAVYLFKLGTDDAQSIPLDSAAMVILYERPILKPCTPLIYCYIGHCPCPPVLCVHVRVAAKSTI